MCVFPLEYSFMERRFKTSCDLIGWIGRPVQILSFISIPIVTSTVVLMDLDPFYLTFRYLSPDVVNWGIVRIITIFMLRATLSLVAVSESVRLILFGAPLLIICGYIFLTAIDTISCLQHNKPRQLLRVYREMRVLFCHVEDAVSLFTFTTAFAGQIVITLCFWFSINGFGRLPNIFMYLIFPIMCIGLIVIMGILMRTGIQMSLKTKDIIDNWSKGRTILFYSSYFKKARVIINGGGSMIRRIARSQMPIEAPCLYLWKMRRGTPMTYFRLLLENFTNSVILITF
ncbi:unnamed protein product [Orchesella dallaii]|uniref:Gustatory receptor n=1 Tax=Orchesella dallaii TaxID=48710 RepID=A0ABP1PJN6_9HEXA